MPRVCTVCSHPARAAIEKEISAKGIKTEIARKHGLKKDAIDSHIVHMGAALTRAADRADAKTSRTVLQQIEELLSDTRAIFAGVVVDDPRTALSAVRELRGCLELLGKLTGELQPAGAQVNVINNTLNILDSRLAGIVRVLRPFPEAFKALSVYLESDEE